MAPPSPRASLRSDDHYVLLLPESADEQFLTRQEMQMFLAQLLVAYPHLVDADLQSYQDPEAQALRLLETACAVETDPGQTVQWYAVRLKK